MAGGQSSVSDLVKPASSNQDYRPQEPILRQPCRYFLRDMCHKGEKCRFLHSKSGKATILDRNSQRVEDQEIKVASEASTSSHEVGNSINVPQRPSGLDVCRAWKVGKCSWGDKCRFNHDQTYFAGVRSLEAAARSPAQRVMQVSQTKRWNKQRPHQPSLAIIQKTKETVGMPQEITDQNTRLTEQDSERCDTQMLIQDAREREIERLNRERSNRRQEIQAQGAVARKILQAEQEVLRNKREAAFTSQHIVLGSTLLTCGAGVDIRRVICGFECCRLTIRGIPASAKSDEIVSLFTQQGMSPDDIHILQLKPAGAKHLEATVLTSAVEGKAIALGLDGLEFGTEYLSFEVNENISSDAMGESTPYKANTLSISWRAPSAAVVATYASAEDARAKVRALDRNIIGGRRVKVELNQLPTLAHRQHVLPSIKISGLPPDVSHLAIAELVGTTSIRAIKSNIYNLQEVFTTLRQHLVCNEEEGTFEIISDKGVDGNIVVEAHFETWEHAQRAYLSLDGKCLRPGYPKFRLFLPSPLQFISTIPSQQYHAQKCLWDSLVETSDKGSRIRIVITGKAMVRVRVMGEDKKAVGALKVRVETLVAGERLDPTFWHKSFSSQPGRAFLANVFSVTGVYVKHDFKTHRLKMYGDGSAKNDARQMIAAEVNRLALLEWTVLLKRQSVGYFIRKGLAMLKEILGEESVTLDLASTPCKLTLRGGEQARHALNVLLDQSFNDLGLDVTVEENDICPICYDAVSLPIKLGCNHVYCTACIQHYLTSAAETKAFPLTCMGNEATCRTPIPIPVIQRFLTHLQYKHLVDIAFFTYLDQHPQDFRYCTTPDCTQIYRCNAENMLKCPSCFTVVCSSCHEEGHEGMSCEERKRHKSQEEERLNSNWASLNGVKKCPSCQVWIEKTDGCNHMTCKCGAHICWKCMGVFPSDEIYRHLGDVHGGINDGDEVRRDNDLLHALALQRQIERQEPEYLPRPAQVLAARPPIQRPPIPPRPIQRPIPPQLIQQPIPPPPIQRPIPPPLPIRHPAIVAPIQPIAARLQLEAEYQRLFDERQQQLLREQERRRRSGWGCIVM